MARVLVIGATGFIGTPLVRHLMEQDHQVYAMHRGSVEEPEGTEGILCDRGDVTRLGNLARIERFDVVIDLLAMTVRETLPVLYALSGRATRYVLLSSADVYRNYEGLHRKASPEPLDMLPEDAPVRTTRHPYQDKEGLSIASRFPAEYDKIPIEGAVRAQTGFEWSIVRLPMVFGPGDRQRRFARPIWRMAQNRPVVLYETGWGNWEASFGYVENVAEAISLIAMNDHAHGKTVNLGYDAPLSMAGVARNLAKVMDYDGEVLVTSEPGLPDHVTAYAENHDLRYSLRMDMSRLRNDFGYVDTVPLEAALRATVADEMTRDCPDAIEEEADIEEAWWQSRSSPGVGA